LSSARCSALLAWYARSQRDLPWRVTCEPYPVWISEIMLQQTRVDTVVPRYMAWMRRFPNLEAVAAANLDAILKAWEGLGYYRRARFLHATAQLIVREHGGRFPSGFEEILALPGIGRSTAAAIASFCFGVPVPVLDGNVKRVLRRWHGDPEAGERRLWAWAADALRAAAVPSDWNQAMMELGATLCTPRSPDCVHCPVAWNCRSAHAVSRPPTRRNRPRDTHWRVHLHLRPRKGMWLTRRPEGSIWGGLWTPPISELSAPPSTSPSLIHELSHRRLHLYACFSEQTPRGHGRWFRDPSQVAMPTGIRRLLQKLAIPPQSGSDGASRTEGKRGTEKGRDPPFLMGDG